MTHPQRTRALAMLVAALVVALGATPAVAQSPRSLSLELTSANVLTEAQRTLTREYATYWATRLGDESGDSLDIVKARDELMRPLRKIAQPSGDFRMTYTRAMEDTLVEALKGESVCRASNAAKVIGWLGNDRAQTILVRNALKIEDEERWTVRLAAALGIGRILAMTDQSATGVDKQSNSAARELLDAARTETNPRVLRRILEAMALANTTRAQQQMIEAMALVVGQMDGAAEAPTGHIEAMTAAIDRMVDRYAGSDDFQQLTELGKTLGPVLSDFLSTVRDQWEPARQDARTRRMLDGAIQNAETLLKRIDRQVNRNAASPPTGMHDAWKGNDKPKFQADLAAWADVHAKPPYQSVKP